MPAAVGAVVVIPVGSLGGDVDCVVAMVNVLLS